MRLAKLHAFLAGTWGAKLDHPEARGAWIRSFRRLTHDKLAFSARDKAGADQVLLER